MRTAFNIFDHQIFGFFQSVAQIFWNRVRKFKLKLYTNYHKCLAKLTVTFQLSTVIQSNVILKIIAAFNLS